MLKIIAKDRYFSDLYPQYGASIDLGFEAELVKKIEYKKINIKLDGFGSNFIEGKHEIPEKTLEIMKKNIEEKIKKLEVFNEEKLDEIIFKEIENIENIDKEFFNKIVAPKQIKLVKVKDEIFQFLEQREWDDVCKCKWRYYDVWGYCNNLNIEEEFGVFYDGKHFFVPENALRLYPFLKEIVV